MANLPPLPPLLDNFPPPAPVPNLHFLSPFYYSLVVVGSAAIVLTIYNLIIVGFCPPQRFRRSSPQNSNRTVEDTLQRCENCCKTLVSTFKYKKGEIDQEQPPLDNECVVCLSGFEEGEDVRQLVQCKHSFHAICIDKWLCSHSDCPLCRTIVRLPVCRFVPREEENPTRDSSVPTTSV